MEAQEVEECVSKEVERAVIEEIKDWSMESLTVAIPLASRNKKEVVEGLTWDLLEVEIDPHTSPKVAC